ncbi:MAG: DoxX family protein [Reyranella sp.]|nr:DoxX family protein [Reyranella sp.]
MNIVDRSLPFVARFCLILLFPFSALDKIVDYGNAVAQADASGMPVPGWLLLLLGGCLEVFGSLGILLNLYARPLALLFCFYCITTAVLFHNFWIYPLGGADWQANFWPFLKNFGLVGGFLFVAANARMEPLSRAFSLAPRPRS